jgi:myosin heavy subunit
MSDPNRKFNNITVSPPSSSPDKDVLKMLLEIQQKINGSPALNGGFDTLLYKVDKIEESQGKIVNQIEEIHDSIYNPDKGLFARIAAVKSSQDKDYGEIDKKLAELNTWKKQIDKETVEEKTSDKELSKKVEEQQKTIESLSKWKDGVSSSVKASGVAIGGSFMALIGKFLYDYILVHWKLIV